MRTSHMQDLGVLVLTLRGWDGYKIIARPGKSRRPRLVRTGSRRFASPSPVIRSPPMKDVNPFERPEVPGATTKPKGTRELTPRALIAAAVVAAIMGASYPYIVLKLGFGPNVSVVAAFFGYL